MKIDRMHARRLKGDILLIVGSIIGAVIFSQTGALDILVQKIQGYAPLSSFVAGSFFTTLITTPFSIVALAHIAQAGVSPFLIAFWGAFGAMLGDLIIFLFIKDRLAEDVTYLIKAGHYEKYFSVFHLRFFRWLTPFVGALIIASPLPDELGIAMMGLSKMRTAILLPVSYIMNFIGIYSISIIAQALN